jgi:hypothetical protein
VASAQGVVFAQRRDGVRAVVQCIDGHTRRIEGGPCWASTEECIGGLRARALRRTSLCRAASV